MNGVELLNSQLAVRVFDSQELLRQNELVKQLILKNNTANASMSALAASIYTESPAKLISILKKMEQDIKDEQKAQRDHEEKMQQDALQAKQEAIDKEHAWKSQENELDRESRIREKVISVMNFDPDVANNQQIDVVGQGKLAIEQEKLDHEKALASTDQTHNMIESIRKNKIDQSKLEHDKQVKAEEAAIKREEMKNRIQIENQKKDQIVTQATHDKQILNKQLEGDLKLKAKDMEIKKMDLRLKEIAAKGAKRKSETEDKVNQLKELAAKDDLTTKKTLNNIKIKKANKS